MIKCLNCEKHASFSEPNSKKAIYCKAHAPSNYIDVKNKKCIYENCNKQPIFGKQGSKQAEYCTDHKPENYIDIKHKRCIYENCNKQPIFGKQGSKQAEYCKNHKPSNYIDVKNKKCIYENCNKQPIFGKQGSKQAEYCTDHKPENYIDVKNKRCIYENCSIRPIFGKQGSKQAEYCTDHKPENYIDIISKKCIHLNCYKIPIYGQYNSKISEYCAEHKPENYVDIKNKKCIYENCNKQPIFGKQGSKQAEYCKDHKPENYVDLKHKKCIYPNCSIRPSYNFPGYSPEYCKLHSQLRMVFQPLSKRKEEIIQCLYCNTDIHYNEQFCSSCKIYISNGNKTVKKKNKELTIKTLLDEHEIKYYHDNIVVNGCSRKRPDFLIPTNWGNIVLEVDEFQHNRKNYNCECEKTRMQQIYYDIGCEKVLFVRYNPDQYLSLDKKFSSIERQNFLIKFLKEYICDFPKNNLSVVYLFYDYFICNHKDFIGGVETEEIDYK